LTTQDYVAGGTAAMVDSHRLRRVSAYGRDDLENHRKQAVARSSHNGC